MTSPAPKSAIITPRTPPGVMELLPRQQIAFQHLLDTIRRGYERFGFVPVETPVFELTDILLTKSGGETEKQVYFLQSTGARALGKEPELALRFDLTVPLARYVAEHEHDLAFPFRRYQIQRVYRGERAQKGRYRELYQCDIDVIGKDNLDLGYDAEMPAIIYQIFRELDFGPFTIHFSNRKVLLGWLAAQGLEDLDKQGLVLREVDKLDKIGRDKVVEALTGDAIGLSAALAARLMDLVALSGTPAAVVGALRALNITDPRFTHGLDELTVMVEGLAALGVPDSHLRLNLAITRGLDYYTGAVYETILNDYPGIGSVCSGGRYENLAGHYTKSKLPGVGISIGATRLFYQLQEAGLLKPAPALVQVLVTQMDPALKHDYLALATTLRAAGLNTELVQEPSKIAKQMKYADRAGIPFAILMGGDEAAKGTVMIKDMQGGAQHEISRHDAAAWLQQALKALTD